MKSIVLIGFKSCGKTSVGTLLARELNVSFVDTDDLVVQRYCRNTGIRLSTSDIYRIRGEAYFRALEKQVVMPMDTIQTTQVIATGGGTIMDVDNRQRLKQLGLVVHLWVSPDRLKTRIQAQPIPAIVDNHPFETRFMDLYTQRLPLYQQLADIEFHIADQSVDVVTTELLSVIESRLSAELV